MFIKENEDKMNKKQFISMIGLIASIFALYTFLFVAELRIAWKVALIIVAIGWIISCIANLLNSKKIKQSRL